MSVTIPLSDLLKERRMSQADLARATGLREQTISNIARNPSKIALETIGRICSALEIDVDDFIVIEPDPTLP